MRALKRRCASGKSLLPAGVVRVEGGFERGDAVIIRGATGVELGRGIVGYDVAEAALIVGKKSSEIAAVLGHDGRAEIDPSRRHGAGALMNAPQRNVGRSN